MLDVRNLTKRFNTTVAVDDVSFHTDRGEIFGLLGPNGAGKTTTMRMVLHILDQDSGTVTYGGEPFSEATRNILGYLPEERGLYKKSRLMDTLLYFAELRGMQRSHARQRVGDWLKRLDLNGQEARRIEEFSKGNQQKIQFIASVIHDPALIILDEPFSGLDPVNQLLFKDIFQEMKQQGKAIILSTHQMDQAERLSDSLCLINKGKAVLSGAVRDVKKRYGKNSLHVEFDGDGAFMETLPGVHRALLYEHSAELELAPGTHPRALIEQLNPRVELRKVELLEPSLHSIFLQVVGEPLPGNGEGAKPQ
jgi:ABC-2 type transport system ATP-binding protein